ncbi:MAG: 50S ribosomal protein L6 [Elusimicrobiales bacterium]|nr:50S ribosomal protein L6 [Elusimicrobiales bacterium]
MSKIGKQPIPIPEKVKLAVLGRQVSAEGPMGKLSYDLPENIGVSVKDNRLFVQMTGGEPKLVRMDFGTTRARLSNIVQGVSAGFAKVLEISGLGYKAQLQGNKLNMELGFSHPVLFDIPPGLKVEVDPKQTLLTIKGTDKILVGDFAARIRRVRPPEPYQGTGIRYQGEHVARKAGKTAAGASGGAAKK